MGFNTALIPSCSSIGDLRGAGSIADVIAMLVYFVFSFSQITTGCLWHDTLPDCGLGGLQQVCIAANGFDHPGFKELASKLGVKRFAEITQHLAASAWLDSMAATISISADHRSYYMASFKIGSLDTWVHLK